ncbi:MAG: hypothetical protein WBL27_11095 [Salinimicrobium sp.]
MKLLLPGLFLFFFTATCSNTTNTDHMQVSGTIEQQGTSSYQYGTHTLTNEEIFYALKSEEVDLDQYVGQTVTIVADKISGYPLDGGPEYLMVLEVK